MENNFQETNKVMHVKNLKCLLPNHPINQFVTLATEWVSCYSRMRYVDGRGRNRSAVQVQHIWKCQKQRNSQKRDRGTVRSGPYPFSGRKFQLFHKKYNDRS